MRLWDKNLIEVLPREQLVAQWRELSAIAGAIQKNETPNHVLVNFVLDYDYDNFISYAYYIRQEMTNRGIRTMNSVWEKIISLKTDYTILPIDHFLEYFDVTAKYRIKRSGSSNVGKSKLESVKNYINSHDYIITNSRIAGDKLFMASPQQLHEQRFLLRGIEYMFSLRENEYELRKLSNTYNANVIFSIKYKSTVPGMTDNNFIYCLM